MKSKKFFKGFYLGLSLGICIGSLIMILAYVYIEQSKKSNKNETIEPVANKQEITEEVVTDEVVTDEVSTDEISTDEASTEAISTEETKEPVTEEIKSEDDLTEEALNVDDTGAKETITIEVKSGMNSTTVCQLLEDEGVIDDARDFDSYLISNQFSTKIRVRSHEFTKNMSYEDIANQLITEAE